MNLLFPLEILGLPRGELGGHGAFDLWALGAKGRLTPLSGLRRTSSGMGDVQ